MYKWSTDTVLDLFYWCIYTNTMNTTTTAAAVSGTTKINILSTFTTIKSEYCHWNLSLISIN